MREAVGIFDVSHLGKARVRGPGAAAYVNATLSNDLGRIGPGQAQYTLCCDAATGGVVDDLIAYLHADDQVFLVPNAANTAEVLRRLPAAAPARGRGASTSTATTRSSRCRARAPTRCWRRSGCPPATPTCPSSRPPSRDVRAWSSAAPATPASAATSWSARRRRGRPLWDALLAAGRAGAGCCRAAWAPATRCAPRWATRCTGRTSASTSPRSRPGSGWAVGWKKDAFWGREALRRREGAGPRAGAARAGRRRPRRSRARACGCCSRADGAGRGGHLRHLLPDAAHRRRAGAARRAPVGEGDEVAVDVRGRREVFTVTRPPFVESHVR